MFNADYYCEFHRDDINIKILDEIGELKFKEEFFFFIYTYIPLSLKKKKKKKDAILRLRQWSSLSLSLSLKIFACVREKINLRRYMALIYM